jgi:hypothetical protein
MANSIGRVLRLLGFRIDRHGPFATTTAATPPPVCSKRARRNATYEEFSDALQRCVRKKTRIKDLTRPLESVRAFYVAPACLTIRRSMSRIIARMMNAA